TERPRREPRHLAQPPPALGSAGEPAGALRPPAALGLAAAVVVRLLARRRQLAEGVAVAGEGGVDPPRAAGDRGDAGVGAALARRRPLPRAAAAADLLVAPGQRDNPRRRRAVRRLAARGARLGAGGGQHRAGRAGAPPRAPLMALTVGSHRFVPPSWPRSSDGRLAPPRRPP